MMPTLSQSFLGKVLANLASVKVWIMIAAVVLVCSGIIWSEHFRDIIIALIAAREIWKVTALRQRARRADGATDETGDGG